MEKELAFDGYEMSFIAPYDDYYLNNMGRGGPVDILPIFDAFCSSDTITIDVGANIGITSIIAVHRSGSVIAVEPIPETYACLRANVERHGMGRVQTMSCAAGSEPSVVTMLVHRGWGFGAFVGSGQASERYPDFSEVEVDVRTIDSMAMESHSRPVGFIKTDTEGFELEVLAGSREILNRDQPVVFLEANHYCLNVFRRISIVTFTERICETFESVYAVDSDFKLLDLKRAANLFHFFHENVVNERFPNMLCGPKERLDSGIAHLRISSGADEI